MNYRIGLDIGIGSVGWAVVSAEEEGHPARIEDFGTRIFPSGETGGQQSESLCKGRRQSRGVRRLERRRAYRKRILKNHFLNIGLFGPAFEDEYAEVKDADVYLLKVKGLDEKLSPAEIYKCLVHTCNHRGYRDFYEPEEDDEEAGMNESAANQMEKAFLESGKRTISEYLVAAYTENGFVKYRNRAGGEAAYQLVRRDLLRDEAEQLLRAQAAYYPCLTEANRKTAVEIIFRQRDFEDGPGDPNDKNRRYQGFLETLGKCPYYKEEDRGFRGTVIADVFAVTNTLSQYRFVCKETGEYTLDPGVAEEIVRSLLENAKLTMTDVKRILKSHGYELYKSENSDDKALGKAVKFLSTAKKCVEAAGMDWAALIAEDQFDLSHPSLLHRIGELLSKYQTPSRRKKEMEAAGIPAALIAAFKSKKLNGTAAVSYRYMCDSVEAFLHGDIYGNFQANFIKMQAAEAPVERVKKLLPKHIEDREVRNNRTVFKAINETRKIVNAIIDVYGSPAEIVIEVASELGKSVEARGEETARQRKHEKENDNVKKEIAALLGDKTEVSDVTGAMIERYKLFKEQEGKCAYSGKPLGELKDVVRNADRLYEVDHIVPYSLILDNTLQNKMLVFAKENQRKGQRTPLMYMEQAQAAAFLAFVNHLCSRKENPISRKKAEYCRLPSIYGPEAEEKLGAWKSRNINDTRYITKYIAGIFEKYLQFTGDKKQHVFPVKGAITQKFRRIWFPDSVWGQAEKDRSTYLNHALDAVVCANLTKAYIEIGSDALRLIAIFKAHGKKRSPEYEEYMERCVDKMSKYYGFAPAVTRRLLSHTDSVPSYVPRLSREVKARFNDTDPVQFEKDMRAIYGNEAPFIVPPHMPVTSLKQDKKFRGCIADDNPIRVVEIDGVPHKIKRVPVGEITAQSLKKLRTEDTSLLALFSRILEGKDEKYTVEKYMKEQGLRILQTENGQPVRKVSVDCGPVSNYYRKEIGEGNYTNLGMLKYYCIELYRDVAGNLCMSGVRFVDIVKKNGKLYRKVESLPADYVKHEMYLFPGDYIRITNGKGKEKFEGYYTAVFNINQTMIYGKLPNEADTVAKKIGQKDTVKKYYIDILGKIGGKITCSEPLPCIRANGCP